MKQNGKQQTKGNGTTSVMLHVEFVHPTAKAVAIAGSFNDWRPEATAMIAMGNGRWVKELALPAGTYEYLLVADGKWMPDPSAKESVPNPFGGENSLVTVPKSCAGNGIHEKPQASKP